MEITPISISISIRAETSPTHNLGVGFYCTKNAHLWRRKVFRVFSQKEFIGFMKEAVTAWHFCCDLSIINH